MKIETRYYCEICNRWYETASEATACEAKAVAKPQPVGLLSMGNEGDLYDHRLAFAIADSFVEKHSCRVLNWACRDTGYGDSLGEETCGGMNYYAGHTEFDPVWLERPPMKRLIKWLRENGHEPLVCVNGVVVDLDGVEDELRNKESANAIRS